MLAELFGSWFAAHQEALWLTTLMLDLAGTVLLYRFFGRAGLQVAIATAIVLANLQGPKLTIIFGLETSLGVIFYSSIFFATDVLSENYGKAEAAKAVWMGFVVSVIVLVMLSLGLMFLPSTNPATAAFSNDIQDAYSTILNFSPRFILGSLLAYLISQRFDVWAFHRIRQWTGERWLWLRNNGSTMVSQMVDSFAVITITHFYAHGLPVDETRAIWPQLWVYIGSGYVFKATMALLDTLPFYAGVGWLSRYLEIDPNAEHARGEV